MEQDYKIPSNKIIRKKRDIYGYLPEKRQTSVIIHRYVWNKTENAWEDEGKSFELTSELELTGTTFPVYECIPLLNSHISLIEMLKELNNYMGDIIKSIKTFDSFIKFLNCEHPGIPRQKGNTSRKYCILQNAERINFYNCKIAFRFFYIKDHVVVEYARYMPNESDNMNYSVRVDAYRRMFGQEQFIQDIKETNQAKLINMPSKLINDTKLKYYTDFIEPSTKNSYDLMCLCSMIESPIIEAIMKSKYTNICNMLRKELGTLSPAEAMEKYFFHILGEDNPKKSLHQRLGLPLCALEEYDNMLGGHAAKNKTVITMIKSLFYGNEDILINMDRKSFSEIFNMTINIKQEVLDVCYSMQLLFRIFGRQNYISYIRYLCKVLEDKQISIYFDYLNVISMLTDNDIEKKWKFHSNEEINNAHEQAVLILNLKENKRRADIYKEQFDKVKDSLKKYEYFGETFSIISPSEPVEILTEGRILHHCVASYLSLVCEGKTSILFVRKSDDLSTPFFTLEIRNNKVRQCHGLMNRNIGTEIGLTEFIKNYCSIKKINFVTADNVL